MIRKKLMTACQESLPRVSSLRAYGKLDITKPAVAGMASFIHAPALHYLKPCTHISFVSLRDEIVETAAYYAGVWDDTTSCDILYLRIFRKSTEDQTRARGVSGICVSRSD